MRAQKHIPEICIELMHRRMDQPDWNPLKVFLETAETGSLSAAARKLGLSQPTLSRLVFDHLAQALAATPQPGPCDDLG